MDALTFLRTDHEGVLGILESLERGRGGGEAEVHAGTPEFERALTEFIPAARAHIEFEQSEVWPAFREAIPAETSNELGRKMAAAKAMAPTRPHPGTPSTPGYLKSVGMVAAVVDKIRDMLTGRRSHYPPTAPPA
ncbi:hypothetical protein [Nocardia beijingensis]